MSKHLIDTDLYLDLIRTGESHSIISEIYKRETPGIYFSSVVAQELLSGAQSNVARKLVQKLILPFEKARRIVTPTHGTWKKAGNLIALILRKFPQYRAKLPGLVNDVLLAADARSIGATLYTRNREDFLLINSIQPFSLVLIHRVD